MLINDVGSVELTMLVENEARGRSIISEHGLSYWLKTDNGALLFDCGQGAAILPNAETLGIDLSEAKHVVLSHGHYDHTGGLPKVLELNREATLWMHPHAIEPKFSGSGGKVHRISEAYMESQAFSYPPRPICPIEAPTEILPGIMATGSIPRETEYEDTGGDFYLDAAGTVEDPILDDMSLFFKSRDGLVVILGCAHAGVVNTLNYILSLTGENRIDTVIGGMHLLHANDARIDKTIEAFRELKIRRVGPCHCTGFKPTHRLYEAWGAEHFIRCHAGMRMRFA